MSDPTTRLEAALARLGDDHEPPDGWQARVLEATSQAQRTRRWWQVFGPMLVLAAAIAVIVSVWPPRQAQVQPLVVEIHKGGAVMRGDSAQVHDVVHATAAGADGHRALWIYRGDDLVLACPGTTPSAVATRLGAGVARCGDGDGGTIAELELTTSGVYTIVALTSDAAIPAPGGIYDTDVGAAKRAGASDAVRRLTVR